MNSRRAPASLAAISRQVDQAAPDLPGRSADPAHLVSAWPRPVSVLATGIGDRFHAVTATTVSCIDVAPVLVMAVVPESSRIRWLVDLAGGFAVTLLGSGQAHLAERFAVPGRPLGPAQFEGLRWHVESSGAPVLDDAGPWLDCRLEHVMPAGAGSSSALLIGRALVAHQSRRPGVLLRRGGTYHCLSVPRPAPPAPEPGHDPSLSLSITERERG